MTLKLPRLTFLTLLSDKPPSKAFQRFWDYTMSQLENVVNGHAALSDAVAALKSGVAMRDSQNEFTDLNIFDVAPDSQAGYMVAEKQVIGPRDTGWTAGTGTPSKGAYAAYGGQTMGASYSQSAVQALDNAAKATAQRLLALEAMLRTHGLMDG